MSSGQIIYCVFAGVVTVGGIALIVAVWKDWFV